MREMIYLARARSGNWKSLSRPSNWEIAGINHLVAVRALEKAGFSVIGRERRHTAGYFILRSRERAWHVFGVHATRSEDDDRANSAIVR